MKKRIALILLCLMLTGCAAAGTETVPATSAPAPTTAATTAPAIVFTLYTPNDNADGFLTQQASLPRLNAQGILDLLIGEGVLREDIAVNSLHLEDGQISVDFNAAFREQLVTYGTAGEHMMVGSVVNTLLSAYGGESVCLTVDGGVLESGHVIYDFPLTKYE